MVHSSRLAVYAFLKRDQLNLQVSQHVWPHILGFDVFDYEVSIEIDGIRFTGRGVAENESLALDKAIGEAFERSLAERMPQDRRGGGFAVHQERERAVRAAKLELIERDAFFCHYLTSTPFRCFDEWKTQHLGIRLQQLCRDRELSVDVVSLTTPANVYCALTVVRGSEAKGKRFGLRLGLGCTDTTLNDASSKAILEMLPNLSAALLNDQHETLTSSELFSLDSIQPVHHQRWALHEKASGSLDHCLTDGRTEMIGQPLDPSEVEVNVVGAESLWPSGLPLLAAVAHHPTAIKNFTGSNAIASKFQKRLEQFSGKAFADIAFPPQPHPLG